MGNAVPIRPADEVYLETPYVSVRWDSGGGLVLVEWKAWADSTEYRAAHEAILRALRAKRSAKLMIDARNAKVISDDDQRWLSTEWIPRAVAAGRRWTAVVMPTSALVKTIVENIDKGPERAGDRAKYFDTCDEAKAWLSTVA